MNVKCVSIISRLLLKSAQPIGVFYNKYKIYLYLYGNTSFIEKIQFIKFYKRVFAKKTTITSIIYVVTTLPSPRYKLENNSIRIVY